jgi:hypothetical protein
MAMKKARIEPRTGTFQRRHIAEYAKQMCLHHYTIDDAHLPAARVAVGTLAVVSRLVLKTAIGTRRAMGAGTPSTRRASSTPAAT